MNLWIQHLREEWRLATSHDEDELPVAVQVPVECSDLMALDSVLRFALSSVDDRLRITPILADRHVVSQPQHPFYIPARTESTVYVTSPMWIRIEVGETPVLLTEIPIFRPSDTWFGPTPSRGELCYASRTFCRLRLEDVAVRPHRAHTAVTVRNKSAAPFLLERMKLPVVYLPLFCARDGVFWTRDVKFDYREGEEFAPLRYGGTTPARAADAELICGPRQEADVGLAVQVFTSLFSGWPPRSANPNSKKGQT
ncbi:MAG: hypothetical protein MJE77_05035 [Proteobacteria bacterium]|nr:hypothetical protein [Pseudomonadota bacterium]